MSQRVRCALAALSLIAVVGSASAQKVIEGRLVNGTTGGSASAQQVSLVRLAGGMSHIEDLTDVVGEFRFEPTGSGPYLVRVSQDQVSYTARVPPTEEVANVEVTVYETTDDASVLRVSIPHLIVIVDGPKVHVSRVFEILNPTDPPRVVVGQPGGFRFDLPDEATVTNASVTSGSMPLRQEPVETPDGRGQTIAFAIKPGVTRYEIEHEVPYDGAYTFRETLYHGAVGLQAIVLPASVEVDAPKLEALGVTEREGVSFRTFRGRDLAPGQVIELAIRGDAVAPLPPGAPGAESQAGGGARPVGEVQVVENHTSRGPWRKTFLLGGGLVVLAFAFGYALLAPDVSVSGDGRPSLSPRSDRMLRELAALDDQHEAGAVTDDEHELRRSELKHRLRDELRVARWRKRSA